ncbi:MAG: hypothetical protein LBH68_04485, partial [Bifidobacteriaceae bacterium]|nr:hypothetical protein [Bifidobacteriaceae bacterium]
TEPNQLVITVADRASSSNGGALSLGAQPDTALALVRGLGATLTATPSKSGLGTESVLVLPYQPSIG